MHLSACPPPYRADSGTAPVLDRPCGALVSDDDVIDAHDFHRGVALLEAAANAATVEAAAADVHRRHGGDRWAKLSTSSTARRRC